eukprot:GHRR01023048.1.p1 GENE.GHRR01023048.1~~GHRR01023048.1.p1  ORF type:complete len:111 (-),score=12.73 GHRR01023048.1:387-719(-)
MYMPNGMQSLHTQRSYGKAFVCVSVIRLAKTLLLTCCRQRPLEALLASLQEEANPALPPWYICIDTLAQHLDTTPSRDKLIKALQTRGYAACLCHIEVGLLSNARLLCYC